MLPKYATVTPTRSYWLNLDEAPVAASLPT